MNFQPNKQLALKAALLVVLAANVSFEPLQKTMSETLASSSEVKSTVVAEPNTDKATNTETVVTKPTSLRVDDCKAKATGKNLTQVGDVERLRFCGKHMESITFFTEKVNGETHTHVKIAPLDNKGIVDAHVSACLPYNDSTRAVLLNKAKKDANERLCEENTPEVATTTSSKPKPKPATTSDDEATTDDGDSVEELEASVAKCEMKKTRLKGAWEYKEIRGEEKLKCNVVRLRNIDKTLRAELGRKPTKDEVSEAVNEIVNEDVKEEIRDLAKSSDPEDNRDAKTYADAFGDRLGAIKDRYSIRDKNFKKTINAMKGYESLANVSETTHEYDESLDSLREKTMRAQMNYDRTKNVAYLQQLNQLKAQGFNLSNQFEYNMLKNDPFFQVESNNWLSSSEVSPFRSALDSVTSEYTTFWNYLMGRGTLSESQDRQSIVQTLPSNAFDIRGNPSSNLRSNNLGLPTTIPRFNNVVQNPTPQTNYYNNNPTGLPTSFGQQPPPRAGGVSGPFGY